MPFPPVKHCIVCDLVRNEEQGKLTILGFLGIVPDVAILALDIRQHLPLTFVLTLSGTPSGVNQVSMEITEAAGRPIFRTPVAAVPDTPPKATGMGLMAF